MTADISNARQGINEKAHRKEAHYIESFVAVSLRPNTEAWQRSVVDLRIYKTVSRTYACIWIKSGDVYVNGSGWVGGYGYHKASAATSEAIISAGIALSEQIDGRGETAMKEALKAICIALGYGENEFCIIHAHG